MMTPRKAMKRTPRVVHRIVIALTESLKTMQVENASLNWGRRKYTTVIRSLDVTRHLASDARKVAALGLPVEDYEDLVSEIAASSDRVIEARKRFMARSADRTTLIDAVAAAKRKHVEVRERIRASQVK